MSLRSEGYKPAMVNESSDLAALIATEGGFLLAAGLAMVAYDSATTGGERTAALAALWDAVNSATATNAEMISATPAIEMHDREVSSVLPVSNDVAGCCSKQPKRGWIFAQKAKKGCDCYPFTWTPKMEKAADAKRKIFHVAGHSGPFGVPLDL